MGSVAAVNNFGRLKSCTWSRFTPLVARYIQRSFSTQTEPKIETDSKLTQKVVNPLKHKDFFGVSKLFTVKDLFLARVHLGHKEGSLNDYMRPFVLGSRLGHLIFDLDLTAYYLREALNFTAHIAFRKGVILFVNRNSICSHEVEKTAQECGEYAQVRYWRKGLFTNALMEFGAATRLPDLVILFNTLNDILLQHDAVVSSAKMLIPTVAIVDTNCNPTLITYPVPANDDTPCAIYLYCKLFKEAILLGKQKRKELEDQGVIIEENYIA